MLPVIAIVGRPNVGKSTLFNELTKSRQALVVDLPGVTRDRLYGEIEFQQQRFIVIDTGGLSEVLPGSLASKMSEQSWLAIREATVIFFMVDARAGVLPEDLLLANKLREEQKNIYLIANKTDGLNSDIAVADFYSLGLGEPIPLAASHGRGISPLMHRVIDNLALTGALGEDDANTENDTDDIDDTDDTDAADQEVIESDFRAKTNNIRVALIGRPNVGKSTLVNRILGEERMVVFDEPGTTRDTIHIPFERQNQLYTLIDTAGVRKRARIHETVEKFSVVKTLQAVEECDVVLMVLDAQEGITEQDLSLLGFVLESGRSVVIAINKWDGLPTDRRLEIKRSLRYKLSFIDYAKIHFISALHGSGVGLLFSSVQAAYRAATKTLPTSRLNQVLAQAVQEHTPPLIQGRRIKLRYAHTGGHKPPLIVIHGNQTEHVPESYKRYLINTFRKAFRLIGTPIRIEFKTSENPYKGKRNLLTPRQIEKRKRMMRHHKR